MLLISGDQSLVDCGDNLYCLLYSDQLGTFSRNQPPQQNSCYELCYAKTRSRVMRRLFQASIHDEDHPERPLIGSGNLLAADVCRL